MGLAEGGPLAGYHPVIDIYDKDTQKKKNRDGDNNYIDSYNHDSNNHKYVYNDIIDFSTYAFF